MKNIPLRTPMEKLLIFVDSPFSDIIGTLASLLLQGPFDLYNLAPQDLPSVCCENLKRIVEGGQLLCNCTLAILRMIMAFLTSEWWVISSILRFLCWEYCNSSLDGQNSWVYSKDEEKVSSLLYCLNQDYCLWDSFSGGMLTPFSMVHLLLLYCTNTASESFLYWGLSDRNMSESTTQMSSRKE